MDKEKGKQAPIVAAEDDGGPADDVAVEKERIHNLEAMIEGAKRATENEHKMGLFEALRMYPKASAWSILISVAVIMEGFDVVLLSNFYAYPEFKKSFGNPTGNGDYQLPAQWQAGLSNGVACGQIFGLLINGIIAERWGYRKVYIGSMVCLTGFIFLFFFANSLPMLLAAEVLCGIPWGIFQTLTTSYAAEVAPVALRAYLTTWVNACWGIGQLVSVGMLRGLLSRTDEWGWRIPYALQWVWPPMLIVVAALAPESPWWLVRRGRIDDARASLRRLAAASASAESLDQTVDMMQHTIRLEKEVQQGASYIDCFRGADLRRTECTVGAWACQQLCGSAFMSYSTYFFQQAGIPVSASFSLTMGQYAINTGGVVIAWLLMGSLGVGRRTLYLWGAVWMFVVLMLVGGVGELGTTPASWAAGSLLLVWSVSYQFTVGTICYSLVTEYPSRQLLIKTLNLGRATYCVLNIVKNSFMPYMLNPTAWNWKSRTAFFWAGLDLLVIVWVYFRLPEPTGFTYAELDRLFELGVPARKFQSVGIDVFRKDDERLTVAKDAVARAQLGSAAGEKPEVEGREKA
ncbi:hypothetical protein GGTG_10608 [Gaeumannomyces tritici R3-111a-1]|uniref:Major facilitator superfamily (MFS) profile domain-containing protein n=1 Tax=Gaeumannomyces tritici (strain R3-111a-1) TaxID=644352 RepID=J3PAT3_GAET3|nr:hypothetical protein GGTG_10608 [Gaeumannomyces tritici R3-111a-1]EJT71349.1 hypothetical protein GGTG_10608 [Gaeumannomyces tritici R3-111a-1]